MLIVHLSDLHLMPGHQLAYAAADTRTFFQQTIQAVLQLRPFPDVVLITGDIADKGAAGSYINARKLLSELNCPVFLVPGNHDHKEALLEAFPELSLHLVRLKDNPKTTICYAIEDFPVKLIGLDSVIPGQHGGGLDPRQLAWLDETLGRLSGLPCLIFMHHPPFASGISHMDQEPFQRVAAFKTIIKKHPQVQRILGGHLHRSVTRNFAGTTACVAPGVGMQLVLDLSPGALSQFILEPPAFLLHSLVASWNDQVTLTTYQSLVPLEPDQFGQPKPFFDVSPAAGKS